MCMRPKIVQLLYPDAMNIKHDKKYEYEKLCLEEVSAVV